MTKYRYTDKPPLGLSLTVITQSAVVAIMNMSVLLLIFRHLHLPISDIINYTQWMFIAYIIATLVQCFKFSRIGVGMFMPSSSPIVYLAPGLYAASVGGISLMAGMMIIACCCELLFSQLITRVRALLPKEICGLALLIVGIQTGIIAFQKGFSTPNVNDIIYFITILSIIICFNVWCKGSLKNLGSLYAVVIGVILLLLFPSSFHYHQISITHPTHVLGLPQLPGLWHIGFQFDLSLVPIFILTAFTATIRVIGIALIAKTYESDSARPDYKIYQKAIRGDAISGLVAALFTGTAINVSPVTSTLTIGAKCTSKVIAIGVIVIYACIALSPLVVSYMVTIPSLLINSVLMWYAILLAISGLQIMQPSRFQIPEYYSIGLPLILAMTIWVCPDIYQKLPEFVAKNIMNPLLPTLVLSMLLTLIFHLGHRKKLNYHLDNQASYKLLNKRIKQALAQLLINNENISYIMASARCLIHSIITNKLAKGTIDITTNASKSTLVLTVSYEGVPANYFNMDKTIINNLVEDEATHIGLIEYFHKPADKINYKITDNKINYILTYFLA